MLQLCHARSEEGEAFRKAEELFSFISAQMLHCLSVAATESAVSALSMKEIGTSWFGHTCTVIYSEGQEKYFWVEARCLVEVFGLLLPAKIPQ